MSYNIFMLYHYNDVIVSNMNSSITYNDGSSLLLNDNLGISYVEMKLTICHGLGWNYNDIEII
jgi:hypothetical protein